MRSFLKVAVGALLAALFLAAVFRLVLAYVTMD
jgi:hypothetical protein